MYFFVVLDQYKVYQKARLLTPAIEVTTSLKKEKKKTLKNLLVKMTWTGDS